MPAIVFMAGIAKADPAKLPENQPVALFVDVSEDQVSAVKDLKSKQFDFNGVPVLLGTGPNSDVGLKAGRSGVDLGSGFSLDTSASISRGVMPNDILSTSGELNEMAAAAALRYSQSGWDIALFPEIGTTRFDASRLPDYVIGGSIARQVAGGWGLKANSRYAVRRTTTRAGTAASGAFGFTHLPLSGARLDLGYYYDGNQPKTETATVSHGPTVALNFDLAETLKCSVAYRYEFAGDLRGDAPEFVWLGDGGQDLSLGWNWDLASEGIRGTTFSADFAYHQDFSSTVAPASGSGGINLVMAF